jgi:hypothetical protein
MQDGLWGGSLRGQVAVQTRSKSDTAQLRLALWPRSLARRKPTSFTRSRDRVACRATASSWLAPLPSTPLGCARRGADRRRCNLRVVFHAVARDRGGLLLQHRARGGGRPSRRRLRRLVRAPTFAARPGLGRSRTSRWTHVDAAGGGDADSGAGGLGPHGDACRALDRGSFSRAASDGGREHCSAARNALHVEVRPLHHERTP